MKKAARKKSSVKGLESYCIHSRDSQSKAIFNALTRERKSNPRFAFGPGVTVTSLDAETMARSYLQQALASDAAPTFTAPVLNESVSEYKSIGTEAIPLTGTTTVKFRQFLDKIPVYGSLVTVELDGENELIGINSSTGLPKGISSVAKVSAAQAVESVSAYKLDAKINLKGIVPRLYFFFDVAKSKWHLAFILEDVPVNRGKSKTRFPVKMDFVVDAHSGSVIAAMDRTSTIATTTTGVDCLGLVRTFGIEKNGATSVLKDSAFNVVTFDFKGKDPDIQSSLLPGTQISSPPTFTSSAVSAHANASEVSRFMRNTLMRNNIDGAGGAMVSTINGIVVSESEDLLGKEWINAYWDGTQMVYGLRLEGAKVISMSAALDVVAHEMTHGVTDRSSRLEYRFQSGALNESYSDIFGIIVSNFSNPSQADWNWEIGGGLQKNGRPFRNFADPTVEGQPDHMRDFAVMPNTRRGDNGGVHVNSGIHNKTAHNVIMSKTGRSFLFSPKDVAILFYLALTQQLSRSSQFVDSRRAVIQTARTLFRALPTSRLAERIAAIETAYSSVGID